MQNDYNNVLQIVAKEERWFQSRTLQNKYQFLFDLTFL